MAVLVKISAQEGKPIVPSASKNVVWQIAHAGTEAEAIFDGIETVGGNGLAYGQPRARVPAARALSPDNGIWIEAGLNVIDFRSP